MCSQGSSEGGSIKTIIAGSRDITDYKLVEQAVKDSGFTITEVVSGGARGVDSLGEQWAMENGIPIHCFPANWDAHGKAAGFIRNSDMACYADALIAITNGSRGTANMIAQAKLNSLKLFVKRI